MVKKKIVVIDDEKDFCTLVKDILEDTDKYEVLLAHNGTQGQELCEEHQPALIFLDYVMPDVTGDKVLIFLRENQRTKGIPVIVTSGLGETAYFYKDEDWKWIPASTDNLSGPGWEKIPDRLAEKMGVKGFLPKPFSADTLLAIASDILSEE